MADSRRQATTSCAAGSSSGCIRRREHLCLAWPVAVVLCSALVRGGLRPHARRVLVAVSALVRSRLQAACSALDSVLDARRSVFGDASSGWPRTTVVRVGACDSDGAELGAGVVKIWRCWCRLWSELDGLVLLCSSGEVGPVLATDRI
jgi:hypothetical protein